MIKKGRPGSIGGKWLNVFTKDFFSFSFNYRSHDGSGFYDDTWSSDVSGSYYVPGFLTPPCLASELLFSSCFGLIFSEHVQ